MKKRIVHGILAVAATGLGILGIAGPASAATSSSSLTVGGNTYSVKAETCNAYWASCSWSAEAHSTKTRTFTHRGDVRANGYNVSINISASPSANITGNSTLMATASRTVTGRSSYMSGQARPSIFSVSVAARSRLTAGSTTVSSGWATW